MANSPQGFSWDPVGQDTGNEDVVQTDGLGGSLRLCTVPGGTTVNGMLFDIFAPADLTDRFENQDTGGLLFERRKR